MYKKEGSSTIQLNHVAFIRNKLPSSLLVIRSNSNAIVHNKALIENNLSWALYDTGQSSTILPNHVKYTRNKLGSWLLWIWSSSRAVIQNNTLIENNVSWAIYRIDNSSTIQLTWLIEL